MPRARRRVACPLRDPPARAAATPGPAGWNWVRGTHARRKHTRGEHGPRLRSRRGLGRAGRLRGHRAARARQRQTTPHQRAECADVEGLRQKCADPFVDRGCNLGGAIRADDYHRNLPQLRLHIARLQHVPAGKNRHHQIEHDDVRMLFAHQVERFFAVGRLAEDVAVAFERRHDHFADARIVVDDQHAMRTFIGKFLACLDHALSGMHNRCLCGISSLRKALLGGP
jgi:hypothetical protein